MSSCDSCIGPEKISLSSHRLHWRMMFRQLLGPMHRMPRIPEVTSTRLKLEATTKITSNGQCWIPEDGRSIEPLGGRNCAILSVDLASEIQFLAKIQYL